MIELSSTLRRTSSSAMTDSVTDLDRGEHSDSDETKRIKFETKRYKFIKVYFHLFE
jgi:hypothetical protein